MVKKQSPIFREVPPKRPRKHYLGLLASIAPLVLIYWAYSKSAPLTSYLGCHHADSHVPTNELCPLSPKIAPSNYDELAKTVDHILHDEGFRNSSAAKLGGAVQIPTEMHDGWKDVNNDEWYGPFAKLHTYLEKTFPKVHEKLKVEKVNRYGLVYTWQGSDLDLKPILLAAHQDVVPVEWNTAYKWTHPPFLGFFDGKSVWGRGSSDCKNLLIGLLETVELLLDENKFHPKRTIILGFGYDEEAGGTGAGHIRDFLINRYGKDSFYAVIDEGISGVMVSEGVYTIPIATGEKGYVDHLIALSTPGGHSSVPPDHTSIGIMSQLILEIESSPFDPVLTNVNPFFGGLQCIAYHSNTIDKNFKSDVLKAHFDGGANARVVKVLSQDPLTKYLMTTSQAVDIVAGGIKANALPESVSVLVNSRISVDLNVGEVVDKVTENILSIAEKFGIGLIREGKIIKDPTDKGYFNYTLEGALEVAPVTPWSGEVWDVFTGSLRHFYEDVAYSDLFTEANAVATPGLSPGNTDTKNYWDLTKNIYRYQPGGILQGAADLSGIHSVNEHWAIEHHLNVIAFYYLYLRNLDEYSIV